MESRGGSAGAGATLWIADGGGPVDPETPLLGLTIRRRAILTGERAGFSRILVEGAREADLAGSRAEAVAAKGPAPSLTSERLVVLLPRVVAAKRWLQELALMPVEPGQLETDPGCAAVLETDQPGEAVRVLITREGEDAITSLSRAFPAAASRLSSPDRFEIAGPEDLPKAERWMLDGLVKDSEGFMSRHVERKISLAISRRLSRTSVTPNQMTIISVAIGLLGAALFLSPDPWVPFVGSLLVLAHSILDGCDGELARLKFQESRFGGVLDFWGDNVVHSALFAAISIAWAREIGRPWPLLLGGSAVLGTILCAGFVFWKTMVGVKEGPMFQTVVQAPDTAFAKVADALAKRDFLYLVVLLSALHWQKYFLALAAVGSPAYFVVLVAISAGRRRPDSAAVPVRADNVEN